MNYLKNSFLLKQLEQSHLNGKVTDALGQSILLLVKRLLTKGNWRNYPLAVKDELISNSVCDIMNSWYKFDVTKSNNPFAYFTSIANNSFRRTINKEKSYLALKTFMYQYSQCSSSENLKKHIDEEDPFMDRFLSHEHKQEVEEVDKEFKEIMDTDVFKSKEV